MFTKVLVFNWFRDLKAKVSVLVSRLEVQGPGLDLDNLTAKVFALVSRPEGPGLGLGLGLET